MKATSVLVADMLAKAQGTGGGLEATSCYIGLFASIVDHDEDTAVADLTLATGNLAVLHAVTTWSAQHELLDGSRVIDAPLYTWSPASSAEGQIVRGWFLSGDSPPTILLGWGTFPAPITLVDETSEVGLVVRVGLNVQPMADGSVSFNG